MSSLKKTISIISFLLLSATVFADKLLSDSSKLVVIITVEDMNQELIDKYFNEFDGGFKRLASGTYYPNVEFQYLPTDYATDIATLFSGTNPNFHGIIGSKRFFSKELKYIHSLTDPDAKGLNDDWHLSGKPLLSTTYADRLSEDRQGLPKIVSVATDPTIAMLMAGHSGLPIYMNNLTGEWSTSSYYSDAMPK
ncbi:MAG: alkaline phosphatase family protein [Paludibacteraceae bacterium]|nr:alkaline phosphatase family protein [Paludibacteraceae bacterium]